ncbi:methyltransferase family protein [Ureibacillus thermosphaericus]|uniref:methyltransferase family protein n=1 Tax=Ureibacillus thermosphaericus TaxID=51173 RepID=UPI0018D4DD25|nr:isoprenylcysteine carboxylmethyltransferase family protein [Ureibacillus thermosphaericus]
MQGYFAILTLLSLIILVIIRAKMIGKKGIIVFRFGELDKKDFLIPPFALLYFYLIFAEVFGFPKLGSRLFYNGIVSWVGVVLCTLGIMLFLWSLISFGKSFRIGIDEEKPGELITKGAFAISRNPIYTSFGMVLAGIFFIMPNWIKLLYDLAGGWLFNRQVKLEEASLRKIYGKNMKNTVKQFGDIYKIG